ncbi:tetratricopeptide repeat protein [uncultured Tenacibaculum sp.]|uniref:tetratricopeptide repeat protein n=1 Tax=uncultured Tenacibaculum sp. TaxID=174713 RepID=UPI00262194BD|nr:tetratricopeptide repeat protein [uncultured Tenacibaculum sp.]
MRKQVLALSLGLMTIASFGQKKELKSMEKALNKNDFNGALTIGNSLKSTIESADDKYKTKYYFLTGQALLGVKKYEEASSSFNQLFDYEKKIGKERYTSEARPMLNKIIQSVSDKAIGFYNNDKNFGEAAKYFYLTYKLSPTDTSFAYNAAVSATQAKDYDTALKYYKELEKVGYTGKEVMYLATDKATGEEKNLGTKDNRDLMVKTGGFIKPVDKTSEGKFAIIKKNIALILKEQGKTEEAIAAMSAARKALPEDLSLLLNQAQLYIDLNQMDKFGELMNEAVSLDPNNPTLYYNLGVVNTNQGRRDDAIKYYKKAIELKPDYADAYMNLSAVILEEEKTIVEDMNKNLSNFKKYDQLALRQKEVYKEALPYLEKADSLNRSVDTVKSLMSIYEVLEMGAKAKEFRTIYKSMK